MQLVSLLLLSLSVIVLVASVLFVVWWCRTYRTASLAYLLREDIAHIGVSAVVEYPKTEAPLVALLEEEYARSEAIVVADLQASPRLEALITRYRLLKVNHSYLDGVRALYRSRKRVFRRVVVVDLPMEYRAQASAIGHEVAAYENILHLRGESVVEPNVIAYCANVTAAQESRSGVLIRCAVGADGYFESGGMANSECALHLRSDCPLAWRRGSEGLGLFAMLLPVQMVSLAIIFHNWPLLVAAVVVVANVVLFIYEACCVVTEKSLLARLGSLFENCCGFWVERVSTLRGSRTRDIPLCPSRVRVQSRPARCHEGARPEQ